MMNSDPNTSLESWLNHRRNQELRPRPGGDSFTTSVLQALPNKPHQTPSNPTKSRLWQRLPRPLTNSICLVAGLIKVTLILHLIN